MKRAVAAMLVVLVPVMATARPRKKPKPKKPTPEPTAPAPAPTPAETPAPTPPPPAPAPAAPTPWSQGVSPERQQQANALFEAGNQLFAQQAYVGALEKYRAAVEQWNHPLLRFNLAVTLIRLDRVLEAADALEIALAYGDAPFEKRELYQQALDYQALVNGRVGYVEATCDQPGNVQLDGKPWFTCPGTKKLRVIAGEHAIIGERTGYLTSSQRIVVAGGTVFKHQIKLVPLDTAVKLEYPYRRWIPWAITATGVAIGLGGVGFWFAGNAQMREFEDNHARECSMTGCEKDLSEHPALRSQRDAAELKGTIGISMMIGGGVVTVAGIVLAIANRPKRVLPKLEVAPTSGGVQTSVGWSF